MQISVTEKNSFKSESERRSKESQQSDQMYAASQIKPEQRDTE